MLETGTLTEAAGEYNEDRLAVVETEDGAVFVVADGSGGMADAAEAAEAVVQAVRRRRVLDPADPRAWRDMLERVDQEVFKNPDMGESTAVVVALHQGMLVGASAGDSEAWLIQGDNWFELTEAQVRKPLVGSGRMVATPFGPHPFSGTLLVASDGLFHYARYETIRETAAGAPPEEAVKALGGLVRMPSGGLQGDLSVIVCRTR